MYDHMTLLALALTALGVEREAAESDLLTSLDEATVRRAVSRFGVTHLIVDDGLRKRYGAAIRGIGNRPWFRPVLVNSFASVLVVRKPGDAP